MMNDSIKSIDLKRDEFWKNEIGEYHRLDGPACIWADGTQAWFVNGKYHRLDGPAYIGKDGTQSWFVNDKRHRLDGPAYIGIGGTQSWFVNSKCHRLDGPAFIGMDGTQSWFVNDKDITKEVEEWLKCNDISYPFDEIALMQFKLRFL
jgi:ribosomal protein L24E